MTAPAGPLHRRARCLYRAAVIMKIMHLNFRLSLVVTAARSPTSGGAMFVIGES